MLAQRVLNGQNYHIRFDIDNTGKTPDLKRSDIRVSTCQYKAFHCSQFTQFASLWILLWKAHIFFKQFLNRFDTPFSNAGECKLIFGRFPLMWPCVCVCAEQIFISVEMKVFFVCACT